MIAFCDIQTRLRRTSARFLCGTKPGEGSYSASANEATCITVTDGAVSKRLVEKSLSAHSLFRTAKEKNKCTVTKENNISH